MPTATRDQVIGATQAAGIKPSTKGIAARRIANKHVIVNAVNRAIDCADTIHAIVTARDSGDPATAEIANRLMANKEFVKAMIASVESILSDVKKAAAAAPKAAPVVTHGVGPDYPEGDEPVDPTAGSGLPGTDAAGAYTVAHLMRDLEAQNHAATMARKSPRMGMDAANDRAASMQFLPAWDSNVWSDAARRAFRERANSDGTAAAHMARAGDLPAAGMRGTTAAEETEAAMRRLEGGA